MCIARSLIIVSASLLAALERWALLNLSATMLDTPGMWTYDNFTDRVASIIQAALATSSSTVSFPLPDVMTATAASLSQCTLTFVPV